MLSFIQDDAHINQYADIRKYAKFALKHGVEKKTIDHLLASANQSNNVSYSQYYHVTQLLL